jgi:hypothetical protein
MSNYDSMQLFLNSKYADVFLDNTGTNLQFNFDYITVPDGHYIHLSVVNCIIPWSFYSINGNNNKITITTSTLASPQGTYYIGYGNYNALQLASYLTSLIPNITVTYNTIINKFTFTSSSINFIIDSEFTTCQELLGLSTNNLYNTSIVNALTSYNPINLSSIRTITIRSNYNTGNINFGENNFFCDLCSIAVTAAPNGLIIYNNPNNYTSNLYVSEINNINIKLIDQNGLPILLNNQYFNMILQIDVLKFT